MRCGETTGTVQCRGMGSDSVCPSGRAEPAPHKHGKRLELGAQESLSLGSEMQPCVNLHGGRGHSPRLPHMSGSEQTYDPGSAPPQTEHKSIVLENSLASSLL